MKDYFLPAVAGLAALLFSGLSSQVLATPAGASPSPVPSATPLLCARCKAVVDAAAVSLPAASPVKPRALPFKSVVISVNKEGNSFQIGKKKIRVVHVTPETKLLRIDGGAAIFEEITVAAEVRGSLRKRGDGEFDAVTLKIGTKTKPAPKIEATINPTAETEEGF